MAELSTLRVKKTPDTIIEPFVVTEYQTLPDGSKPDCWFGWAGISVDAQGNIEGPSSDYCQKWYNDDVFVRLLASRMKSGRITLHFIPEFGDDPWGYVIGPDAIVTLDSSLIEPVRFEGSGGLELFRFQLEVAAQHYEEKARLLRQKIHDQQAA